jgi:hypothetical protein
MESDCPAICEVDPCPKAALELGVVLAPRTCALIAQNRAKRVPWLGWPRFMALVDAAAERGLNVAANLHSLPESVRTTLWAD